MNLVYLKSIETPLNIYIYGHFHIELFTLQDDDKIQ